MRYALVMAINTELHARATQNVRDIVHLALEHKEGERALVIYDTQNGLTNILTAAYREVLPHAQFVDFDTVTKDEVIALFDTLQPRDLVVLIQTSSFRLDDFRIRLHLFKLKLKVIEHTHLYRNHEEVWDVYVDALAYDPAWYRGVGRRLQARLALASELCITTGDAAGDAGIL